jgi:predicted nucleic acid-binding Zn ribbon protein
MSALALTMGDRPMALNISFARDYAERYDWLKMQFKSWAFICSAAMLYYNDRDNGADESVLYTYRLGMSAFKGVAPTYHVALFDEKPTIVWEFNSLMIAIQMMFSFMLTDGTKPLRMCKHCKNTFAANHHNAVFCSGRCKNQFNVYKSRGKNNE